MKRTTLFLPDALHERLREEAFRSRISLTELIRSHLESATKPRLDPLFRVAGLCDGPPISASVDEELYGI